MLFVAAALMAGPNLHAQTVDEIVKKHVDAIGGVDNWKKVNAIKFIATMNANGTDIAINRSLLADKGMRVDIDVMGMHGYMIVTQTAGWNFMPWGGQTKPEPITEDDLKVGHSQMMFPDKLYDYAAKGSKIEFLGKDDVDGTECLKLKVTTKDGNLITEYIDPSTYFLIREVQKMKANGQEMEVTTNFSNYQKLPEGIFIAMTVGTQQGEYKITKVEINTIKDESIFKPEEPKKG